MDKRTGKRKSIEQEELPRDDDFKESATDDLGLEEMDGGQGMDDSADSDLED